MKEKHLHHQERREHQNACSIPSTRERRPVRGTFVDAHVGGTDSRDHCIIDHNRS